MIRVTVSVTPRPYEAVIENGLVGRTGEQLRQLLDGHQRLFVVTVPPVRRKWGKLLLKSLAGAEWQTKVLEIPDGERSKKLATVESLAERLAGFAADRKSAIVAFGGGVVGDVAGMLASVYMRGVDVVQIPTTVLAQVDAAIGGKTGVNLKAGKNLLGTFHQPRGVLIDPQVLSSLPDRDYRSGLYEALKCGVIGVPELFQTFEERKDRLIRRDPEVLIQVIAEAVKLKAAIVAADERESNLRQVLNFGHTIGHALEAEAGYRDLLHGEAVAWGMIAATNIALTIGKLDSVTAGRITDAILGLGKLPPVGAPPKRVLQRLRVDKKTRDGLTHFVLPLAIGRVEIVKGVPQGAVSQAIDELRRLSGKR